MSRNYHENRTRVALLFDTLVDKLEHMKSNPEYGEYGEYGGLLDPGLANIILHKGMMIDLLEPDGNIYTGSHSIEIFETMELDSGVYSVWGSLFFLSWLGSA